MKNQTVILLIVAGACGLVTMLGVKQYLAKQNQKEEVPKVTVLVATMPIKQGVPLTEQNTEFLTVEAETCPDGVVTDLEQIRERALKVPRGQGDWILVSQLTEKGAVGAVTGIPAGMRVVTIPVDATTNHSGMLQPGNRIDLLLTFRERDPSDGQQKEKTIPLMEYIEVFAVDSQVYGVDSSTENAKARNISLLVDTEQMMTLAVAKKKGSISTALRSSEDMEKIKLTEVSEDSFTGGQNTQINTRSTMDLLQEPEPTQGFALPTPDIMSQLQAELVTEPVASGPVPAQPGDHDYWTIAIHSGGSVRVERVNQSSEEPIDTTGRPESRSAPTGLPQGSAAGLPAPKGPDSKADGKDNGFEELEEAAAGLLDLFN